MSCYAFAHGQMSPQLGLQEATSRDMRAKFGLPAQMACNVPRQVGATYQGLGSRGKANASARAAGRTKKRYQGWDQASKYISPTLTDNLQRDSRFTAGQPVSILTLQGRVLAPSTGDARHLTRIEQGARMGVTLGAAKRWYDKPHQPFSLRVSRPIAVADPTPAQQQRILGVDVGPRDRPVATSTPHPTTLFAGQPARAPADHQADHAARRRKRVQHTGTRSAT